MTIIYSAATCLVNPAGVTPLTLEQVWKALELKARQPQLFLAVIATAVVLEDDEEHVLREVQFKDGGGVGLAPTIGPKVQERITAIAPITPTAGSGLETFVTVGSPARVLNIVSSGLEGEMYLTFTFEWDHPEIEKGSKEEIEKQKRYQMMAPKGVKGTIDAMRKMFEDGTL